MIAISRSILILSALATAAAGGPALAKTSAAAVVTEQSTSAKVYAGQPVEIRLRTQAGTGFSWYPTSYASKIKPLSPLKASVPGGREVQRFRFKTQNRGTYVVTFSYGQPWKGGTKHAKSRSFTIKVR